MKNNNTKSLTAKIWKKDPRAILPALSEPGSVGYDIYALEDIKVFSGSTTYIRTGLVIQPPDGYFISIRSRSGLATRRLVVIPQGVGTIDPSFCGEEDELLVAFTMLPTILMDANGISTLAKFQSPLEIHAGDRIAQMLFEKACLPKLLEVEGPPDQNSRGGFGSTGI